MSASQLAVTTDEREWSRRTAQAGLKSKTMLTFAESLNSGSNIEASQYLMIRALWTSELTRMPAELLSRSAVENARNIMKRSQDYQSYLYNLPKEGEHRSARAARSFGSFTTVRWQQLAIEQMSYTTSMDANPSFTPSPLIKERLRSRIQTLQPPDAPIKAKPLGRGGSTPLGKGKQPATPSSYSIPASTPLDETEVSMFLGDRGNAAQLQAASDEQIVNQAFISLIDAVLGMAKNMALECTAARLRYHWGANRSWTAVTDGAIRDMRTGKTHAIIEVKPFRRTPFTEDTHGSLRRQESGELACWLSSETTAVWNSASGLAKERRLLLSQDRDQMWIIVGEYDQSYIRYVATDELGSDRREPFLRISEYGPYRMTQRAEVNRFVEFLLAFCIQQGNVQVESWSADDDSPPPPPPPPTADAQHPRVQPIPFPYEVSPPRRTGSESGSYQSQSSSDTSGSGGRQRETPSRHARSTASNTAQSRADRSAPGYHGRQENPSRSDRYLEEMPDRSRR